MNSDILSILSILVGGIFLFIVSRKSRKNYNEKHGKPTLRDNIRLFLSFFIVLTSFSVLMYFFQMTEYILWLGIILAGLTGIPNLRPGLSRDILYSSVASSLIVGFSSMLYYGT